MGGEEGCVGSVRFDGSVEGRRLRPVGCFCSVSVKMRGVPY